MIKVINFGLQSAHSSLTVIQRNGKKVVLAFTINLDTSADKIADVDASVAVTFGLEEVPLSAARKLLKDSAADEDVGAFVALEDGKAVGEEHQQAIAEYVRRYVKALPVLAIKREITSQ